MIFVLVPKNKRLPIFCVFLGHLADLEALLVKN
ncbi:hypothetical protein VCG_003171 [Vibrio cholerae 12129(1)]|nr:hypothetical protein VCG_003171 [Vibrio cholerae 12129(1)]